MSALELPPELEPELESRLLEFVAAKAEAFTAQGVEVDDAQRQGWEEFFRPRMRRQLIFVHGLARVARELAVADERPGALLVYEQVCGEFSLRLSPAAMTDDLDPDAYRPWLEKAAEQLLGDA